MNICLVKDGNHLEDCAMNKAINDDQSSFLFFNARHFGVPDINTCFVSCRAIFFCVLCNNY